MARRTALVVLSLAVHVALAVGIGEIDIKKSHAATAIQYAVSQKKKPPEAAKIDPTPPPKAERAPLAHHAAAAPAPETPLPSKPVAASALDNVPDFGLSLSGGVNGTGIALPTGGPAPQSDASPHKLHKVLAAVAPAGASDCPDPPTRPRPRAIPQPVFTDAARAAGVEGKVRVQLTIDETGRVVDVKLLQGLGYGLDEAALAAARQATFEPALRCGTAERATFNIAMRFSL